MGNENGLAGYGFLKNPVWLLSLETIKDKELGWGLGN
jgi:hypothetical protein